MPEEGLPGGFMTGPVRVGDTVRRRPAARAEFVHRLLDQFEQADWPGAPRFLGFDELGREMLSYLDGHAAWEERQPAGLASAASLRRVGQLVRQFHDLTAGTELAGSHEVVCHNDLSPKRSLPCSDFESAAHSAKSRLPTTGRKNTAGRWTSSDRAPRCLVCSQSEPFARPIWTGTTSARAR